MTPPTIADIVNRSAADSGEFSLLARALETTGLGSALADREASLTVFAPTDAAFIRLARSLGVPVADGDEDAAFDGIVGALEGLGDPVELLSDVLLFHVAPGARTVDELAGTGEVATALGDGAPLRVDGGGVHDNDPDLTDPRFVDGLTDIEAKNGIVHVVDSVILPVDIAEARDPAADEFLVAGAEGSLLAGDAGDDSLIGRGGDDTLEGGAGDDTVLGRGGDDAIKGGDGDDILLGGTGDDLIEGGAGDDIHLGGAGHDRFLFDPSRSGEGHDRIVDFGIGEDQVVLRAVDVVAADPEILGADGALTPGDFDHSPHWALAADAGRLSVEHPNGAIRLDSVAFDDSLDFAALADEGALGLAGLVQGGGGDDTLEGDGDPLTLDDLLVGQGGDDLLAGGSGDDIVYGGDGQDRFAFDPSNPAEGLDRIADFALGRDRIVLDPEDVLAADPELAIGGGTLEDIFAALDASPAWTLEADEAGDAVVGHPGGTITLEGVEAAEVAEVVGEVSFAAAGPAVLELASLAALDQPAA